MTSSAPRLDSRRDRLHRCPRGRPDRPRRGSRHAARGPRPRPVIVAVVRSTAARGACGTPPRARRVLRRGRPGRHHVVVPGELRGARRRRARPAGGGSPAGEECAPRAGGTGRGGAVRRRGVGRGIRRTLRRLAGGWQRIHGRLRAGCAAAAPVASPAHPRARRCRTRRSGRRDDSIPRRAGGRLPRAGRDRRARLDQPDGRRRRSALGRIVDGCGSHRRVGSRGRGRRRQLLRSGGITSSLPGELPRRSPPRARTGRRRRAARAERPSRPEAVDEPAPRGEAWVAASVGPYGASLADGSEYTGAYGLDVVRCAVASPAHPRARRCRPDALASRRSPRSPSWRPSARARRASASPLAQRDGRRRRPALRRSLARPLASPRRLARSSRSASTAATSRRWTARSRCSLPERQSPGSPIPTAGSTGTRGSATGRARGSRISQSAGDWLAGGARLVGGCCRVGPDQISEVARAVAAARRR